MYGPMALLDVLRDGLQSEIFSIRASGRSGHLFPVSAPGKPPGMVTSASLDLNAAVLLSVLSEFAVPDKPSVRAAIYSLDKENQFKLSRCDSENGRKTWAVNECNKLLTMCRLVKRLQWRSPNRACSENVRRLKLALVQALCLSQESSDEWPEYPADPDPDDTSSDMPDYPETEDDEEEPPISPAKPATQNMTKPTVVTPKKTSSAADAPVAPLDLKRTLASYGSGPICMPERREGLKVAKQARKRPAAAKALTKKPAAKSADAKEAKSTKAETANKNEELKRTRSG